MAVKRISITEFVSMMEQYPILDVRSPSEYAHAHMKNAHSLPLFTDEERKVVGTAYKQQGKQPAIKLGLNYFGVKMTTIVSEVEAMLAASPDPNNKVVLVHCWRGGMRSAGVVIGKYLLILMLLNLILVGTQIILNNLIFTCLELNGH